MHNYSKIVFAIPWCNYKLFNEECSFIGANFPGYPLPILPPSIPPLRSFTTRRYSRFSRSFFSIAVRQLHRQLPRRRNERIEEYHGRGYYPLGDNGNWSEMKSFNFLHYSSPNDGTLDTWWKRLIRGHEPKRYTGTLINLAAPRIICTSYSHRIIFHWE